MCRPRGFSARPFCDYHKIPDPSCILPEARLAAIHVLRERHKSGALPAGINTLCYDPVHVVRAAARDQWVALGGKYYVRVTMRHLQGYYSIGAEIITNTIWGGSLVLTWYNGLQNPILNIKAPIFGLETSRCVLRLVPCSFAALRIPDARQR